MNQNSAEPAAAPPRRDEAGRRRRESPASSVAAQRHRRLRYVFFGLASVWGFAAGSVAVLAELDALGHPVTAMSGLGARLVIAAAVALAGGLVVALAYREVLRRGP
jgi:hypothetical protein